MSDPSQTRIFILQVSLGADDRKRRPPQNEKNVGAGTLSRPLRLQWDRRLQAIFDHEFATPSGSVRIRDVRSPPSEKRKKEERRMYSRLARPPDWNDEAG
jgi:hypothetical protein